MLMPLSSPFERWVLEGVSSRRVVVLTASVAERPTRDHLDSLLGVGLHFSVTAASVVVTVVVMVVVDGI